MPAIASVPGRFHGIDESTNHSARVWLTSLDSPATAVRLVEATAASFAGDVPGLGPTLLFARNGQLFAQPLDIARAVLTGTPRDLMTIGDGVFSAAKNGTLVLRFFGN